MSEQPKFTSGPWHVGVGISGTYDPTEIYGADGYGIADAAGVHLHESYTGETHWATTPDANKERSDAEEEANARLIAAAPELYQAVYLAYHDWFAKHYHKDSESGLVRLIMDRMEIALAKAVRS
jgi:hypothetical protein